VFRTPKLSLRIVLMDARERLMEDTTSLSLAHVLALEDLAHAYGDQALRQFFTDNAQRRAASQRSGTVR
jgi:hypothetical protein